MKSINVPSLILILALSLDSPAANAAEVTETSSWSKRYPVSTDAPQLEISNIWGDIVVRPGADNVIAVSVEEVRSAPNRQLFERSKEVLKLNIDASAKHLIMKVGDPKNRWNSSNTCRDCQVHYQFTIEVPAQASIDVGTVNEGKVDVAGITGNVNASNVNGPVSIERMTNCTEVNTVNGPISISYASSPTNDCEFNTINGDVTLELPENANLSISVDLFNGEVSSELPVEPFALPADVKRIEKNGRKKYQIKKKSGFSIGSNGPVYSIASMNGDVRIKKAQ